MGSISLVTFLVDLISAAIAQSLEMGVFDI